MRKLVSILFSVLIALCFAGSEGCKKESKPSDVSKDGELQIFVSLAPQAYLATTIAGDTGNVEVLLPAGQSPHTYEVTAKQLLRLANADLYFRVDVPFEEVLADKIASTLPDLKVVDTNEGIDLLKVGDHEHAEDGDDDHHAEKDSHEGHEHQDGHDHDEHDGEEHEHDAAGESHDEHVHDHGDHEHHADDIDPHTWMSPSLAIQQAEIMRDALCEVAPAHCDVYKKNFETLKGDLQEVRDEIATALEPYRGEAFYVYHPAFGYFAREFGLEQVPVEVGGREPSLHQLNDLIERAKKDHVKLIFVQPQFSSRSADVLADQIGGVVVPLDPLAGDYVGNLRHIAEAIGKALDRPEEGTQE